ncbi:MAG: peroxiredoxin [Solirubrobacterales bacterium]
MTPKVKSSPLEVGTKAPDFTLPDQDGNSVRLYDLLAGGPVVVYFYPKAFTQVCTAEACAFRDSFEIFKDAGAKVVGISADSIETQKAFHTKHRLTYPVLSDQGSKVHGLFGLRNGGKLAFGWAMNDRVTFVIDADGTVKHHSAALFEADVHINEALETVQALLAKT